MGVDRDRFLSLRSSFDSSRRYVPLMLADLFCNPLRGQHPPRFFRDAVSILYHPEQITK